MFPLENSQESLRLLIMVAVEILPTGEVTKSEAEVNQESAASSAALAEERREQFVRRRVPCACPLGTQRLVARHRAWK